MPIPDSNAAQPLPRRRTSPEPLRRRKAPPVPRSGRWRRVRHALLLFVAIVLTTDALVGEKGLVETIRARREARQEAARLEALREENARLREEVRLLNDDPGRIEEEARRQLGLIRPGEVLFILRDIQPAGAARPAANP
jgi:cell division protein FtsB